MSSIVEAFEELFGRSRVAESERKRLLVECGLTEAGAAATLRWLDAGVLPQDALATGVGQVQPGRDAFLVGQEALGVIERMPHLFETTASSGSAQSVTESSDGSADEVARLRRRLVEAHERRPGYPDPAVASRLAHVSADAAIESLREAALRDGWSQGQFLRRLASRVAEAEDKWGRPQVIPLAGKSTDAGEVSEADARAALYGTPKEA